MAERGGIGAPYVLPATAATAMHLTVLGWGLWQLWRPFK
jgi:hypothetical protein